MMMKNPFPGLDKVHLALYTRFILQLGRVPLNNVYNLTWPSAQTSSFSRYRSTIYGCEDI